MIINVKACGFELIDVLQRINEERLVYCPECNEPELPTEVGSIKLSSSKGMGGINQVQEMRRAKANKRGFCIRKWLSHDKNIDLTSLYEYGISI